MTVIQITDIHYDPEYKEFSNTECYEPMCCRSDHGIPKDNKTAAGYWGDYRKCDLPWRTLLNALDQIKKHHKHIDLIYMTGDIVAHSIWETTIEKNTYAIKKVLRKIKEVFPNVPVFPILGNHEPSPLNVYTPPDVDDSISTRWLYELVADEWSVWLPPETRETILQGGYYSVLVKPGFRIVGINSNLCYTLNWFIAIDDNTQFLLDHLNWLAQTLYEAELAREKVHILSHVPINDMCLYEWGKEYKRIIDRFQSTVIAQFVGHTHWDEFELYYSLDDPTKPINVAFNGGSLTHYDNLNSNYKVYKVHPETYDIIDGETWIFNLTEANESPYENIKPHWFKLYSYKEAFNMESLYPEDFDKLAYRMASDKALLQKYAW
ncbi:Sphingomyelin phosphodiesterase [Blattella germanica]|nr:Sphingomyelin phosphodiesterase [Blattella germanica]